MALDVLLLNGPPRSGKDSIANLLEDMYEIPHYKFANELKHAVHRSYGLFTIPADYFEERKDQPCEELYGITPRQAYIQYSEHYAKPLHGDAIWGTILSQTISKEIKESNTKSSNDNQLIVISDSGFLTEMISLIRNVNIRSIIHVHLFKEDCSFINDSRSYVEIPSKYLTGIDYTMCSITNKHGSLHTAFNSVLSHIKQYLPT